MEPIAPWTLEELSARVSAALGSAPVDQANGQVTEVPNARTIRYYATIGLLERPYTAGRSVRYGRRHLLQLVAIKRLQARGLVLADVQRELGALNDKKLEALAALPQDDEIAALAAEVHGPSPKVESRRERSFWSAEPEAPSAAAPVAPSPTPAPTASPPSTETVVPVAGIHLAAGVTLSFPTARPLGDDDVEALRAALGPVVDVLRARGLLPEPEGDDR
ncbi:MAG: MerR family transcriptional regulator [Deltaproteobacteria bacterium]|nr:MerR family transcriptional regulator [Deltaproteobacteria bacterium]